MYSHPGRGATYFRPTAERIRRLTDWRQFDAFGYPANSLYQRRAADTGDAGPGDADALNADARPLARGQAD
jgi:hypothetical protein